MKKGFKVSCLFLILVFLLISSTLYAAPKEVTLRFSWWGSDSRHKATLDAINLYMKETPNVKIAAEYSGWDGYEQKILTQLAGGNAPDLMQLDQPWLANLMAQGDLFLDLNRYKSTINLGGFEKQFLSDMCTVKRKLVGLPTGINAGTYVVNKDFLKKMGIGLDTQWNWDNLLEVGARVHKQDPSSYLLQLDMNASLTLIKAYIGNKTGKPWINNDYTLGFNKQQLTEAFTYFRKLIDSGTLEPFEECMIFDNKRYQDPKWISGKIGIGPDWASSIYVWERPNFELGVTLPAFAKNAKNTGIIVRPAQVISINKHSANSKEALKFLNWFFNDPQAIAILGMSRGVPPTESGRKILADHKILDPNVATAVDIGVKNTGLPENALINDSQVIDIFKETVQGIGFGQLTPQRATDQLIKQLQVRLAELKAAK